MIKKPNSICKNKHCRKLFYACAFCTRTNSWRAVACCPECYDEYTKQVLEAREAKKQINLLPERIDMSEKELKEFMNKPVENVVAITNEELKDYSGSISSIMEQINEDLAETPTSVSRKGRKKKTNVK